MIDCEKKIEKKGKDETIEGKLSRPRSRYVENAVTEDWIDVV